MIYTLASLIMLEMPVNTVVLFCSDLGVELDQHWFTRDVTVQRVYLSHSFRVTIGASMFQ